MRPCGKRAWWAGGRVCVWRVCVVGGCAWWVGVRVARGLRVSEHACARPRCTVRVEIRVRVRVGLGSADLREAALHEARVDQRAVEELRHLRFRAHRATARSEARRGGEGV